MPSSDIAQQSLLGNLLALPLRALCWLGHAIVFVVLLPFRLVKWLFHLTKKVVKTLLYFLLPDLYVDNVLLSLRTLRAMFTILLLGASGCLAFLFIAHLVAVSGAAKIFPNVDLVPSLLLVIKAAGITGAIFLVLAIAGFAASSLLAVFGITFYSIAHSIVEWGDEATESRTVLFATFVVSVILFALVYLLLAEKIPF